MPPVLLALQSHPFTISTHWPSFILRGRPFAPVVVQSQVNGGALSTSPPLLLLLPPLDVLPPPGSQSMQRRVPTFDSGLSTVVVPSSTPVAQAVRATMAVMGASSRTARMFIGT